ncbi:isochorismate synthase, partial [Pseudogracilibacillus auburnensis]|uniref:isochorismate synthase n=1 Tax=Pseudogracilibacillus auburnensis TaxID=1494959 RepID=UPI001A975163
KNRSVLFSMTKKIKYIEPLHFYQMYECLHAERFFWKNDDGSNWIIGLGAAHSIAGTQTHNRFQEVKKQWHTLLLNAQVDNPYEVEGTGPLIFGGFSFDPLSKKEPEWELYEDYLFYLPRYMLTVVDNEWYLTVNSLNDDHVLLQKKMKDFLMKLTSNQMNQSEMQTFSSEEIGVDEWLKAVEDIVDELKSTELKKVVLARKLNMQCTNQISSESVINNLLEQQPTGFTFSLTAKSSSFLGASPERLVKKTKDYILSDSLAGSMARSKDQNEDDELGEMLLNDHKNLFEHELVVAMIEDALIPYCTNIHVPNKPKLLKMPDIQHLYTPIIGTAKKDTSIFDIVQELHPTPALGGVPTKAAMVKIREREEMDRGFYAAPIGWTDYRGNGEFVVAIRSGLVEENNAILFAGCGLVADSKSEEELVETGIKFQPMLRALKGE